MTITAGSIPKLSFGDRVRLARRAVRMSGVELSTAIGMNRTAVGYWESSGREPIGIVDISKKIAEATGCDLWWLISGEEPASADRASGWFHGHPGQKPFLTSAVA